MKTYTFEQTGYQGGERVTVEAPNARQAWRRLSQVDFLWEDR